MLTPPDQLLALADRLAAHEGVTHWAVSQRLLRKGDFFQRLRLGSDCRTATYRRVLELFDRAWPSDLEWPEDVPRPERAGDAA
jgi:hypothetical protein